MQQDIQFSYAKAVSTEAVEAYKADSTKKAVETYMIPDLNPAR